MDSSVLEITKSVDMMCTQMSLNNIVVPRISSYSDVFEFINEYNLVTATLPEELKIKLLVKAFPAGRNQVWFDEKLKPLIDQKSSWTTIKQLIISRFSDTEDRDRHLHRLRELKFVPGGKQKLFDFIEESIISLTKAFPSIKDDDSKIRYIKSCLPSEIKPNLSIIHEYTYAKTLDEFMKGVRQYDSMNSASCGNSSNLGDKIDKSELVSILKELVQDVRKEKEPSRHVVAGIKTPPREPSPQRSRPREQYNSNGNQSQGQSYHMIRERSVSPYNRPPAPSSPKVNQHPIDQNYYYQNYQQQPIYPQNNQYRNYQPIQYHQPINTYYPSPNYYNNYNNNQPTNYSVPNQYQRSQSPTRYNQDRPTYPLQNNQYNRQISLPNQNQGNASSSSSKQDKPPVFRDEKYLVKFGYPPHLCRNCGDNHWERHCYNHLN